MANILVIDDNLDICQLLDRFLTKKGHQVQTTISGKTGLEYVKKNQILIWFSVISNLGKWMAEKFFKK